MSNTRYGLKEVANVIFFDISTNKPVLFFDTLKVSSIENTSDSAEATGGQGNGRIMSWDFGRKATLNMQDALLSDTSLAMLAGTSVVTTGIVATGREVVTATGTSTITATLLNTPLTGTVTCFKVTNGLMDSEVTTFTISTMTITFSTGVVAGDKIMVFYQYNVSAPNATQVTFSGSQFPATYKVVGDTYLRGEDGVDRKMQFVIPKAKLQSAFTLTMDASNVSTFDFKLDILLEAGTQRLYDIIRLT